MSTAWPPQTIPCQHAAENTRYDLSVRLARSVYTCPCACLWLAACAARSKAVQYQGYYGQWIRQSPDTEHNRYTNMDTRKLRREKQKVEPRAVKKGKKMQRECLCDCENSSSPHVYVHLPADRQCRCVPDQARAGPPHSPCMSPVRWVERKGA